MRGSNRIMIAVSAITGITSIVLLSGAVTERLHPTVKLISDCCLGGAIARGGYEHMGTIKVDSASALNKALASAKAGDVVVLAAGDYGDVRITNRKYAGTVTIISASSSNMAHIDRLTVDNVTNLTFKKIDIGGERLETDKSTYLAEVRNSTNITFDGAHVHGLIDGDPTNERSGLSIRASKSVKVINSEFDDLLRGAWVQRSTDVQLLGNNFHDIRVDGLALSAVTKVVIDSNKFTDFHRLKQDHSDAIQFWTTNEKTPSTDIVIRNNQILQGNGTAMQGIFMRDESNALPYERVLIENNLVYESGYANGVTVIGGKAITIKGNTVVSMDGDASTTKIRLEKIAGAVVSKNVTDMFAELGENSGISFDRNITLSTSKSSAKKLLDIGVGAAATAKRLILDGVGFQLPLTNTPATGGGSTLKPAATVPPVVVMPEFFTTSGLYTTSYSHSGSVSIPASAAPLPAVATTSWGRTILPPAQIFHA